MVTPIPGGFLLIALGLTMLICTSQKAQNLIQFLRKKNQFFNKAMCWVEEKVGKRSKFIGDAMGRTRPITNTEKGDNNS